MQIKNIDMEMTNSKLRIIDTKFYERMLEKQSDQVKQRCLCLPLYFLKLTLKTPKSKVYFSCKPVLNKKNLRTQIAPKFLKNVK